MLFFLFPFEIVFHIRTIKRCVFLVKIQFIIFRNKKIKTAKQGLKKRIFINQNAETNIVTCRCEANNLADHRTRQTSEYNQ